MKSKNIISVAFIQGDESKPLLDMIFEHGTKTMLDYMINEYGHLEGEEMEFPPWGLEDDLFQSGNWFLSYNNKACYVALARKA
jgi:hypothetical protein